MDYPKEVGSLLMMLLQSSRLNKRFAAVLSGRMAPPMV
jgi:hypothetical protein